MLGTPDCAAADAADAMQVPSMDGLDNFSHSGSHRIVLKGHNSTHHFCCHVGRTFTWEIVAAVLKGRARRWCNRGYRAGAACRLPCWSWPPSVYPAARRCVQDLRAKYSSGRLLCGPLAPWRPMFFWSGTLQFLAASGFSNWTASFSTSVTMFLCDLATSMSKPEEPWPQTISIAVAC